jgi:aldehyde dehydrogenase (NAD+)
MEDGQQFSMSKNIPNWIDGSAKDPAGNNWIKKVNPDTEMVDSHFADSCDLDLDNAIKSSLEAYKTWSKITPVSRGQLLFNFIDLIKANKKKLATCVAKETGKSFDDALGEVGGAIAQGEFFAGEGRRLYANSLTSGVQGKHCQTIREPHGLAGLIVPANTPIANIAWKIFPALICGNTAILKASEDSPEIAYLLGEMATEARIPDGVLNIIQGSGSIVGDLLVRDSRVPLISFTGSTHVGKHIASQVGLRMGRVSLELGGKNTFVVCDDADIDNAVHWAALSAFSNAGQRCAAASRIIVFKDVYKIFIEKLISKANSLLLGIDSESDLGPIINEKQFNSILTSIDTEVAKGAKVLCGYPLMDSNKKKGFYIKPTLIANIDNNTDFCQNEIFGPVASVHQVDNIKQALDLANESKFGLTAAIHTRDIDQAFWYATNIRSGTVNINSGTYGSEPHMPFGGVGDSGNGTREPGTSALDVYSELKNISFLIREDKI